MQSTYPSHFHGAGLGQQQGHMQHLGMPQQPADRAGAHAMDDQRPRAFMTSGYLGVSGAVLQQQGLQLTQRLHAMNRAGVHATNAHQPSSFAPSGYPEKLDAGIPLQIQHLKYPPQPTNSAGAPATSFHRPIVSAPPQHGASVQHQPGASFYPPTPAYFNPVSVGLEAPSCTLPYRSYMQFLPPIPRGQRANRPFRHHHMVIPRPKTPNVYPPVFDRQKDEKHASASSPRALGFAASSTPASKQPEVPVAAKAKRIRQTEKLLPPTTDEPPLKNQRKAVHPQQRNVSDRSAPPSMPPPTPSRAPMHKALLPSPAFTRELAQDISPPVEKSTESTQNNCEPSPLDYVPDFDALFTDEGVEYSLMLFRAPVEDDNISYSDLCRSLCKGMDEIVYTQEELDYLAAMKHVNDVDHDYGVGGKIEHDREVINRFWRNAFFRVQGNSPDPSTQNREETQVHTHQLNREQSLGPEPDMSQSKDANNAEKSTKGERGEAVPQQSERSEIFHKEALDFAKELGNLKAVQLHKIEKSSLLKRRSESISEASYIGTTPEAQGSPNTPSSPSSQLPQHVLSQEVSMPNDSPVETADAAQPKKSRKKADPTKPKTPRKRSECTKPRNQSNSFRECPTLNEINGLQTIESLLKAREALTNKKHEFEHIEEELADRIGELVTKKATTEEKKPHRAAKREVSSKIKNCTELLDRVRDRLNELGGEEHTRG
jgi:hypothetical protein